MPRRDDEAQAPPAEREALILAGMLMIGAAGRRCGKTTFACELIRREVGERPIVGVKVTTVHERVGPCPRGDDGCGLCSFLEGPCSLSEERGAHEAPVETQRKG
jgi:hypothetical protein